MKKESKNLGFTLVEVIIAIAILTLAITPLVRNFVSSAKVNGKSKEVLKATEAAQNIFEGMAGRNPKNLIIELSGDASLAHPDLRFIKKGVTYDHFVEYEVVVDPVTNKIKYDANGNMMFKAVPSGGSYIKAKKALDNGEFEFIGFKESEHKVYAFAVYGLDQGDGKKYDMFIKLNASEYEDYVNTYGDPDERKKIETRAKISGVNSSYDAVYTEGANTLENTITAEYVNKRIDASYGMDENDVLKSLERTYYIDIEKKPTVDGDEVVVNVSTNYKYKNEWQQAAGTTLEFSTQPEQIFTSSTYGLAPRNIYIPYTPNYNSNCTLGTMDNIVINNLNDLDVNVYVIRTQQQAGNVLENESTEVKEERYAVSLDVKETDTGVMNTTIRTNIDDNIMQTDRTLEDRRRAYDWNTYKINGSPIQLEPGNTDIMKNTDLEIKTLGAQKEESRFYGVTISVFKSEGIIQTLTKDKMVAQFNGKLVE